MRPYRDFDRCVRRTALSSSIQRFSVNRDHRLVDSSFWRFVTLSFYLVCVARYLFPGSLLINDEVSETQRHSVRAGMNQEIGECIASFQPIASYHLPAFQQCFQHVAVRSRTGIFDRLNDASTLNTIMFPRSRIFPQFAGYGTAARKCRRWFL